MDLPMKKIAQLVIPILFPLMLLLVWLGILLSPVFIQLEYRRPGFPPDPFGFSTEERIHWADVSRIFLLSGERPEYYSQFTLRDGSPLYNEREIQHMVDVQKLVAKAMLLLAICGPIFLAAAIYLLAKDRSALRKSLSIAASITLLLLLATAVGAALVWDWIFVTFHHVFFTGDTWLFPYSDSLIRLFPVEFWQDTVVTAVAGILLTSLLIWLAACLPDWLRRRGNTGHA
jgi:integral membrane protein (TIGR01906 family)